MSVGESIAKSSILDNPAVSSYSETYHLPLATIQKCYQGDTKFLTYTTPVLRFTQKQSFDLQSKFDLTINLYSKKSSQGAGNTNNMLFRSITDSAASLV